MLAFTSSQDGHFKWEIKRQHKDSIVLKTPNPESPIKYLCLEPTCMSEPPVPSFQTGDVLLAVWPEYQKGVIKFLH